MTGSRRRPILRLLVVVYVLAACGWGVFSLFSAEIVAALYDGRVESLGSLLIRKQTEGGFGRSLGYYQARFAGLADATFVLMTLFVAIVVGLSSRVGWVRILASNLAVAFLLLFVAELSLRALGIEYSAIARPGLTDRGVWSYDRTKGWYHQPHTSGQSHLGGPDAGTIEINSLGLRDREVAAAKPEGVKRVLVFGDSYAFGVGVDSKNVFSARLEERLAASASQPIEVVNMGVSGYSTDQEYLLFRERGLDLDPDLVVLIVCHNDFTDNTRDFVYFKYYKPYFTQDAGGDLTLAITDVPGLSRWQRVKVWLGQESRLWNLMRNRESEAEVVQQALNFFKIAVPRSSTENRVDLTAAIIQRFVRDAGERGVPVLVTTTAGGIDDDAIARRRTDGALARLLAQSGVDYLDLWPAMLAARRADPDANWDFPDNLHWNVDAHRVAAEVVAEQLRASGSL